jgi:hypothetical protein
VRPCGFVLSVTDPNSGLASLEALADDLPRLADALRAAAGRLPPPDESGAQDQLVVIGTGIQIGQLSIEAASAIVRSDRVHYSVTEPAVEALICALNTSARPLMPLYELGKPRSESYERMVETILRSVRDGQRTAAVFYGHPGVFAFPPHEVVRRARSEGLRARMLAAVSAEDCLFADLGVDPADAGCQSLEATDFLLRLRTIDPSQLLILWQIGVLGAHDYQGASYELDALPMLVRKLLETYPAAHPAIVYEGASTIGAAPRIERITVESLISARLTPISTLVVPPLKEAGFDLAYAAWLPLPGR